MTGPGGPRRQPQILCSSGESCAPSKLSQVATARVPSAYGCITPACLCCHTASSLFVSLGPNFPVTVTRATELRAMLPRSDFSDRALSGALEGRACTHFGKIVISPVEAQSVESFTRCAEVGAWHPLCHLPPPFCLLGDGAPGCTDHLSHPTHNSASLSTPVLASPW